MAVAGRWLPIVTTAVKGDAAAATTTNKTTMLASYKEWRPWRWAKTIFFLVSMLLSLLLVCAPPLLIAILDVLLPSALLLSTSPSLFDHLSFRNSLADIPIVSAARSLLILCVYVVCSGRGPYLGITVASSFLSVGYVSAKAAVMAGRWMPAASGGRDGVVTEVLFLSSLAFAVAHVAVAYKTSCRERRKMLVYRIDIESVSAYHNDFPNFHKIGLGKSKQSDLARSVIP